MMQVDRTSRKGKPAENPQFHSDDLTEANDKAHFSKSGLLLNYHTSNKRLLMGMIYVKFIITLPTIRF